MPLPSFTPPQVPVVVYSDPNKTDRGLIEYWNTETTYYQALDLSAPHPNTRDFPGFRLGIQTAIPNNEKWIKRVWVSDQTNPDWFNYEIKYASESNAFPIYIRQYRETKKTYTPLPKGQPLSSVIQLNLLIAGDGYTPGTFPNIDFISGSGSGAAGYAIVNLDGTIADLVLSDGGTGYTSPPSIVIDDPTIGTTATGTAQIQPQTAILTSEHAEKFPEDSEFYGLYLNVTRVYETLPSPILTSTVFDKDGILKTSTKQRVLVGTEVISEVLDGGNVLTRKYGNAIDTVVSEQITEVITIDSESLLDLPEHTTSIPNVIPIIFRALIPTHVESHVVPGVPAEPALVLGEFEHSERALTPQYKEVRSTILDNIGALPITVSGLKETDQDKEVVTISMTLELDSTVPSVPTALVDVDYKKLGNGLAVEILRTVPEVFPHGSYTISVINLIPPEMRAAIPIEDIELSSAGTANPTPALLTGELSRNEEQVNKFVKRVRTKTLGAITPPISIFSEQLTEEYGGGTTLTVYTLDVSGAMTIDEGLHTISSKIVQLGNGYDIKTTEVLLPSTEFEVLSSRLWDDNMRVEYDETSQVVAAGTPEDADPGGSVFAWLSEVKAIDKWRSRKTNSSKPTPDYTDESTALVSYEFKPYRFPGYLQNSGYGYYERAATAVLCAHLIKTWWIKSTNPPAQPTFDEIITSDVIINNLSNTGLEYARNVLHDGFTFGIINFPPTTPTATQYAFGDISGSVFTNCAIPDSFGINYSVGDTITFSGDGGSASITITAVDGTGRIGGYTPQCDPAWGWTPEGLYGPYSATGGTGTGLTFSILAVTVPTYTPGTAWIGSYRIIAASVTPEKEKDIWKVTTESVIMR